MFVHTHRMYTPRENSNAHCRLLIMTCQCRFTDANKYAALLQDLDDGGGCMCWGGRMVYGNYVLSAQFCCEPKTA